MVKTKAKIFLGVVVTLGLMLGVMIQVLLLARSEREGRLQGEALARAMSAAAVTAFDDRAQQLARLRERWAEQQAALTEEPAMRAEQRAQEQAELLILVNPWNPLPEGYTVELRQVGREFGTDYRMDERCADELEQMIFDCREAGNHPWICSAYRTQQYQQNLFDNKVLRVILEGNSPEEAPAVAAMAVAVPGTSEHQLGLAVDIIDELYTNLDEGQESTSTQRWLMENCWRYGFILRYPVGATEITGIIYEPWHYRYVGERYAEEISALGVTLEEYLAMRRGR